LYNQLGELCLIDFGEYPHSVVGIDFFGCLLQEFFNSFVHNNSSINNGKPRKFLHLSEGNMMHGSSKNHSSDGSVVHGTESYTFQGNRTETHPGDESEC
jgi:hypothetical protein